MRLPPGFAPSPFRDMLQVISTVNPMLGPLLWKHLNLSEDDALVRIHQLEQQKLVQFAIAQDGAPACFVAPDYIAWHASEPDRAFAAQLVNFWDTTGEYAADGRIVSAGPNAASVVTVYTPEGELSMISTVAQRLLEMHLLIRDDQGRLHGPSKDHVMAWTQEHGNCDFCSDPHTKHVEMVPDFELIPRDIQSLARATGVSVPHDSVGGWATCETCHTLIVENRRTDLLQRAITASRGGKFTAAALKGLHQRFWTAMDNKADAAGIGAALIDFIEDRINPDKAFVNPKLQAKAARKEAIRRLTGLTQDEMEALGKGDILYKDVTTKLTAWRKKFGVDTVGEQKVAEMLNTFERPVMPPHVLPHWQQALDRKVEAMSALSKMEKALTFTGEGRILNNPSNQLLVDMSEDLKALKVADVYSFNADTMHTIMAAAASIPHEAPLKSIEIPMAQAGWFWFAEPYPVASAPVASDSTHGLLWSWDTNFTEPTIRFSAYVVNEKLLMGNERRGSITPSTKWYWPLSASIHEMMALSNGLYDEGYGEGSPESIGKDAAIGKEHTLKVVMELSQFFMQCCQWFRQTVPGTQRKIDPKLTQETGHIERHARKRYEKEFKASPTVRVIALRKSAVTATEREETTDVDGKRHLKVRHVVSGHHRMQPCGPGRKDVKLIWVDAYVKGPEDGPFQPPKDKVFAVIR